MIIKVGKYDGLEVSSIDEDGEFEFASEWNDFNDYIDIEAAKKLIEFLQENIQNYEKDSTQNN